tara:strand:- start:258 stop:482 length:225 start_codon:yes stop_codon:yes gene_type:complete
MKNSYDILDKLNTFSDKDIIQFYHNAYNTECFSNGHYKGQMNGGAKMAYAEELKKRGIIKIPDKEGVFNGEGTY